VTVASPQEMIRLNAPGAVGITNVVLWVKILKHLNPYLKDPQPVGLLKIVEVGTGGQVMQAVFSQDGVKPFVSLGKYGASMRDVSFSVNVKEGE